MRQLRSLTPVAFTLIVLNGNVGLALISTWSDYFFGQLPVFDFGPVPFFGPCFNPLRGCLVVFFVAIAFLLLKLIAIHRHQCAFSRPATGSPCSEIVHRHGGDSPSSTPTIFIVGMINIVGVLFTGCTENRFMFVKFASLVVLIDDMDSLRRCGQWAKEHIKPILVKALHPHNVAIMVLHFP